MHTLDTCPYPEGGQEGGGRGDWFVLLLLLPLPPPRCEGLHQQAHTAHRPLNRQYTVQISYTNRQYTTQQLHSFLTKSTLGKLSHSS